MNHKTYKEVKEETKSNVDLVGDEYLAQILNNDLSVQIGDWIFRVNKSSEKVFALPVEHAEYYNDLINENTSNKLVLEFTTEDDVFYLLEDEDDSKSLSRNCQSSKQNNDGGWLQYADWTDDNGIYGTLGKRYKFERKIRVRYDNWGIYRKLNFEFWHKENFGGTWDETNFSLQVYGTYLVRNGSIGSYSLFPTINPMVSGLLNSTGKYFYDFVDDHKELIVYRGTRCLKEYELRGWSWFRNRATLKPNLAPNHGTGVYIRYD